MQGVRSNNVVLASGVTGDVAPIPGEFKAKEIQSTSLAFAAICPDGSVVPCSLSGFWFRVLQGLVVSCFFILCFGTSC